MRAHQRDTKPEAAEIFRPVDEGKLERQLGDFTPLGEKQPGCRVRLDARRGNAVPLLMRPDLEMKRDTRLGAIGRGVGRTRKLPLRVLTDVIGAMSCAARGLTRRSATPVSL